MSYRGLTAVSRKQFIALLCIELLDHVVKPRGDRNMQFTYQNNKKLI
ncbi:palindromic element RPE4 domain-containing protein [Rickettsia asembonensis]|nr:palindromic element RPE4 domain-containing protein [Rickettsia asembonensis]